MDVLRKSKVVKRGNESILSVKTKKLDLITKASEFDEYILIKKPGVSILRHENTKIELKFSVKETIRETSLCAQSPTNSSW